MSSVYSGAEVSSEIRARRWLTASPVPANRHHQGVVLEMSVRDNMTLTGLGRFATRLGAIRRKRELAGGNVGLGRLDVRPSDPARTLMHLSGGNQQKVVLCKWLRLEPRVILLDEPTQGIDIGAKALIHGLIRKAADDGAAVVVATSDDEEICDICDRRPHLARRRARREQGETSSPSMILAC